FKGYHDLLEKDPDFEVFRYAYEKNIITGDPSGNVRPDGQLQRDEAAKITLIAAGSFSSNEEYCHGQKPYPDIELDHWSAPYICLGKEKGSIKGYLGGEDRGLFRPEKTVNRVEFLALILRTIPHLMLPERLVPNYRDIERGQWYVPFAKFSYDHQLFSKTKHLFPEQPVTRREAARILYQLR